MKGLGKKLQRMVEAYVGPAAGNATEAARIAGYSFPEKVGTRLRKQFSDVFEAAEEKWRAGLVMDGRELDERITSLARNPAHRDHFKALELLAKMQGKLDPKVTVQIERKDLASQLDETVKVLIASRQAQLIEGTVVAAEIPPPAETES